MLVVPTKEPPSTAHVVPSRKRLSAGSIHPVNRKRKADSFGLSATNEDGVGRRSTHSVPSNGRHKQEGVPIYNGKGIQIGHVVDGVFYKRVRRSEHMLRKPPAWANDIDSLKQVERANGTFVVLDETEWGIRYSAPLARIWDRGREFNRGFGDQIFMVLGDWDTEDGGSKPRPRDGRGNLRQLPNRLTFKCPCSAARHEQRS